MLLGMNLCNHQKDKGVNPIQMIVVAKKAKTTTSLSMLRRQKSEHDLNCNLLVITMSEIGVHVRRCTPMHADYLFNVMTIVPPNDYFFFI